MNHHEIALTRDALCATWGRGERPTLRFFWGHRARADGALSDACFSQWWPASFELAGQRYSSAEQFMMASKARLFSDGETLGEIMAEHDPAKVKALGRRVRGFDDARWRARCFDLVTAGNVAKFSASSALRAHLLGTGEAVLVEASPTDTIWGIGLAASDARASDPRQWRGQNLLGFALVRARAIVQGALAPVALEP